MKVTKYILVAVALLLVTLSYLYFIRDEPSIGWTWYKVGAIVSVLLITNAGQFWVLRGETNKSVWRRMKTNAAIWSTFAVILILQQTLIRPGLVAAAGRQGSETWRFIVHGLAVLALLAMFNTALGYLFSRDNSAGR